jgi:hypothetical protein
MTNEKTLDVKNTTEGGGEMTTTKKTWWKAALLLAALALAAGVGRSEAADPDTDALTITITPNVDYGVDLDTATAALEGVAGLVKTLDLGSTTFLVSPATMTITGNFNRQEVQLTAQGLDTWGVDTDELIGTDSAQVYGLFAVDKTSRPLESEFEEGSASHLVTALTAKLAGEPFGGEDNTGTDNLFEIATGAMTSGANMDNLVVGTQRQLWLRLDAPAISSSDENQRIQVIVTAVSGTTQ